MDTEQSFASIYCRECGYALIGLSESRCPECGQVFDPADPYTYATTPQEWRLHHRPPFIVAAVAACMAAVAVAVIPLSSSTIPLASIWFATGLVIDIGIVSFSFWLYKRFSLQSAFWFGVFTVLSWVLMWQPYLLANVAQTLANARAIASPWGADRVLVGCSILNMISAKLAWGLLSGLLISDLLFLLQERGWRPKSRIAKATLSLRRASRLLGWLAIGLRLLPAVVLLGLYLSL